eukprot:gene14164-17316_t
MNFLVTNDDGIRSPFLHELVFALLAAGHTVALVAPKTEQSWIGAAKSRNRPVHATAADLTFAKRLLPTLERKAGRVLFNGFGTGVEVSHAMVHGGPFPSTSDSRSTSVGASAIDRFLRPVSYQDVPAELLAAELADGN